MIPMILEAFGGITSLFTLHPAPRATCTGKRGARARQHRLRRVENERQVVLRTPHAAARSGCAGGRREGYVGIRKKITEMKMRLIKVDALKATGRG